MMSIRCLGVLETLVRKPSLRWTATMAIVFSLAPATVAQKVQEHEKDDPRARAEYLVQKRGGKQGTPPDAREHALKEVNGMLEREGKAYWQSVSAASSGSTTEPTAAVRESTIIAPSASQWTPIGPQPLNTANSYTLASGRVTALAVDPRDATGNTVYLGAAQGGVWKTTNGGSTWTAIADDQPSLAIGSIAIDATTNPSTIYVGTGEENFGSDSYYGVGILKLATVNGVPSWQQLGTSAFTAPQTCSAPNTHLSCGGPRVGGIALQPCAFQPGTCSGQPVILAAVQNAFSNTGGIFRSTDGGSGWLNVLGGVTGDSVVFASATIAYAGIHNSGVYKSTNGGTSFVATNGTGSNIINTAGIARVVLAVAPSDNTGNTVYASIENDSDSTLSGFYKTVDGGTNWAKLGPGNLPAIPDYCGGGSPQLSQQCFYDNVIAVNPVNPNVVFVGGSGNPPNPNFLVFSTTAGSSWSLATTAIHADQHAMAFTPDGSKLYIGNDGGVYSTTNTSSGTNTVSWTNLNNSLNTIQFYGDFAIHPTNSQIAYGGAQDNGTQKFSGQSLNGTLPWDEVACGDGAAAVFDVNNPTTIYANCQDIAIRKSTDGVSFFSSGSGLPSAQTERVAFIPPLVGDSSANAMNLYFGTYRLWRSANGASSWQAITGDLTGGGTISNIGVTSDNSNVYTVSDDGKIFRVSNLATSAVASDVTGSGLPAGVPINAIAISPSDSNIAYLALAGFNAGQHVFKTTTGGGTWTSINGNSNSLPNSPANDIVIDPDFASTLYVATDVGVFKSTDDGANWSTLQNGMPKVAVFGLKLHRPSRTLRAATHGRGMWDLAVPSCSAGPCASLNPGSLTFAQQKVGGTTSQQTFTLTNAGTSNALLVGSVTTTGDFTQTNNCIGSVAANGGTCTIIVTFTASSGGGRSGTLTVTSNANPTTTIAALSGVGVVVPLNDVFDFAKVINIVPYTDTIDTMGAVSAQTDPVPPSPSCVTLSTTSDDPLDYDPNPRVNHHAVWYRYTPSTNGSITIDTFGSAYDTILSVWTGDPRVGFTAVNPTTAPNGCNDDDPINPGVRTSRIQNLPVSAGVNYGILVIGYYPYDAPLSGPAAGSMTIHVSGTTPALLSKASVNMSSIIGRTATETLTVFNNTGTPITPSSVVISGAAFSRTETCTGAGTIANGGSCAITVSFSPGAVGSFTGSIAVNYLNGSPSASTVTLSGTGVDFTLSVARNSRNGATGTGVSTAPGSRPTRPVRNAADIIVVAGQSKSMDLELASTGTSNEVVTLECVGAPAETQCDVGPAQVTLGAASIPVKVTFNSSKNGGFVVSGRAKRLTATTVRTGNYELQINARVGDLVRTISIAAQVIVNQSNKQRLPVQQTNE